jgi:hypothetical protein
MARPRGTAMGRGAPYPGGDRPLASRSRDSARSGRAGGRRAGRADSRPTPAGVGRYG